MSSVASPFEVRCARCDVTFPIETRICVHCGGATHSGDNAGLVEANTELEYQDVGHTAEPIDVMSDSDQQEIEIADGPASVGRSIIRSLGGFIWVIVLIGFTLARNCGGE